MTVPLRKQISLFLPVSDWKAVRLEAARRRIPITELCRRWLEPGLDELRHQPATVPMEAHPDFDRP